MNATDTPSVGGQMRADPRRLSAFLGLGLEAMLQGQEVPWDSMPGGWDAWWMAVRSDGRLLPDSAMEGTCKSCREAAASFLPSAVSTVSCECFEQWAQAFTSRDRQWSLPQRLTVAMIKPGVPDGPIRAHLRGRFPHREGRDASVAGARRRAVDPFCVRRLLEGIDRVPDRRAGAGPGDARGRARDRRGPADQADGAYRARRGRSPRWSACSRHTGRCAGRHRASGRPRRSDGAVPASSGQRPAWSSHPDRRLPGACGAWARPR